MAERARILVVDDEPANRKLLADLIRVLGYGVIVASSGAEAIAAIDREPVDVVLLDLMMPGMSGLDVLDVLAARGLTPALPVLVVSAVSERDARLAALDRGATDFVTKPIDRHDLGARVRTAVRLRQLHNQLVERLRDCEQVHAALMAGATVPILVLSPDRRIIEANAAAEALLEPETGPLVGSTYSDLLAPEDRDVSAVRFASLVQGEPVGTRIVRARGRGGVIVTVASTPAPVDTAQGRLIFVICRDVTEELRAQRELAEREAELRRAQAVAHVGSWHRDLATGDSRWSAEARRMFGLPEGTPVSFATVLAACHPDDVERLRAADGLLRRGQPTDLEYRVLVRGEERWLRTVTTTERGADGAPMAILGTTQDITDRKRAELAREESLRFTREVLDSLEAEVAIIDEHGAIVATNRAWREWVVVGCVDLAEGANYLEFCDGSGEFAAVGAAIRAALAGALTDTEVEYRWDSSGEDRWYTCRVTRFRGDGPPRAVVAHHDVTRLVVAQAEAAERAQRLDLLSAQLPLVLWEATGTGRAFRLRWFSENAERVLGVPAERLTGPTAWGAFVHPDDRAGLRFPPVPPGSAPESWFGQFRWRRADGTFQHIQGGASARPTSDGSVVLVGFALDVSKAKELEAAYLQAQKMEAVGQLTGGIAHDFNNLLSVILASAEFARDEMAAGDPRYEDMSEVLAAAERAAALTRQLLTFSSQQGSLKRPIDVNASLDSLVKLLRRSLRADIDLLAVPSHRPAVVRMDPVQLDQVLVNLAVNAGHAMPGGGRLRITVAHVGSRVHVVVADTGSGIDRATLARIFDPFFTTKPIGIGTGLGLYTCRAIVTEAGGTIRADSEPGRGATFTIELPMCHELVIDERELVSGDLMGAGEHVLVVEDDIALRRAIVRILREARYAVFEAPDGAAGIRRLDEAGSAIDLIVCDVVLPGCDGYAVVRHAKVRAPRARVLLTSGYPDGTLSSATDMPVGLRKPYTRSSLLRAARAVLTGS